MVTLVLGIIWATLVISAGIIGNVAVERAAHLAQTDVSQAVQVWLTLHAVELGLGGGNEIAGGVWIGCVSLAGLLGRGLGRITIGLGLLTAAGGLLTLIPAIGDVAGAVFGLVNGLLIAYWDINSLIATLGTLGIGTGLTLLLTDGGSNVSGLPRAIQSDFAFEAVADDAWRAIDFAHGRTSS